MLIKKSPNHIHKKVAIRRKKKSVIKNMNFSLLILIFCLKSIILKHFPFQN